MGRTLQDGCFQGGDWWDWWDFKSRVWAFYSAGPGLGLAIKAVTVFFGWSLVVKGPQGRGLATPCLKGLTHGSCYVVFHDMKILCAKSWNTDGKQGRHKGTYHTQETHHGTSRLYWTTLVLGHQKQCCLYGTQFNDFKTLGMDFIMKESPTGKGIT